MLTSSCWPPIYIYIIDPVRDMHHVKLATGVPPVYTVFSMRPMVPTDSTEEIAHIHSLVDVWYSTTSAYQYTNASWEITRWIDVCVFQTIKPYYAAAPPVYYQLLSSFMSIEDVYSDGFFLLRMILSSPFYLPIS